jgi:aminoglycoside phosphotransferase (APT) family kinase protein
MNLQPTTIDESEVTVEPGSLLDPDEFQEYFSSYAPHLGVQRVLAVDRFSNGLSSLSCRVDVETDAGPVTWALRAEPEHGVIPPYDIVWETRLLSAVGNSGLPVPEVVHVEADEAPFGHRFALTSFIEGEGYQATDARFAEQGDLARTLQMRFVEMLARIHQIRDHGLGTFEDGPSSARAMVAVCRQRLADTEVLPRPLLRHALDVLDQKAPDCDQLVLLHGDYRLPNLKWRDGEIVGILDWELARVGDPVSDLAFTQTVGAGPCAIQDELADYYCELTGNTIDERRIAYYQMLEMTKSCIIGLAGAHDLRSGGNDLRLMSVAGLAATADAVVSLLESQLEIVEGIDS